MELWFFLVVPLWFLGCSFESSVVPGVPICNFEFLFSLIKTSWELHKALVCEGVIMPSNYALNSLNSDTWQPRHSRKLTKLVTITMPNMSLCLSCTERGWFGWLSSVISFANGKVGSQGRMAPLITLINNWNNSYKSLLPIRVQGWEIFHSPGSTKISGLEKCNPGR